jgi:predicted metal-binding membrane protein
MPELSDVPAVRTAGRDPAPVLWAVVGGSWIAVVALTFAGGATAGEHDHVIEHSGALLPFAGVWMVMIGAMMLPSMVPMARAFTAVSANQPRPAPARAVFYATYLVAWLAFALVALAGDTLVHQLAHRWEWLHEHEGVILGSTLLVAGAFQFSPLKKACLRACRSPLALVLGHYTGGVAGGWRTGRAHALNCLGCCWALMLVMFATGVGSVAWMAGLTGLMVAEKTVRWGERIVVPAAVLLIAAGSWLTLSAMAGA